MADPVLRIPVDDDAFKRYLDLFQQYQEKLKEQPKMWEDANEAVADGIAANLSLADAIGESVSAAVRLGLQQERNAQARQRAVEKEKQRAQEEEQEAQRASSWREKAINHVKELSRTSAGIVRGFGNFAANGGAGGVFGGISAIGKEIGGPIGGIVNLAGHVLNAGYEASNSASDRGLFARGIGASLGQQEKFQTNLGRYTNTDQGIDAVMNARGDRRQWGAFARLGITDYNGPQDNATLYGEVLRASVKTANRYRDASGNINWTLADAHGASAFASHEDINRLAPLQGKALDDKINEAVKNKSSVTDKDIDAATKSVIASDNLAVKLQDLAQHAIIESLDPALDKTTTALNQLADVMTKIYNLFSLHWFGTDEKAFKQNHPLADAVGIKIDSGDAPPDRVETPEDIAYQRNHPWWSSIGMHADKGTYADATSSDRAHYRPGGKPGKQAIDGYGEVFAYMRKAGFSEASAAGIAAGSMAETNGKFDAINPHSGAFALGQWLGDRKTAYQKFAAKDHVDWRDHNEQMKYLAEELKGHQTEKAARTVIGAPTWDAGLHAYVYDFMRPQGKHGEKIQDAINDVNRGTDIYRGAHAANVNLNVTVSQNPGTQASVTANSAAKGH